MAEAVSTLPGQPAAGDEPVAPPVSARNLLDCLNSTRYWITMLPEYANDMQRRADRWSIVSGALSAVAGLGVWATISKETRIWAQVLVAAVAFASALSALVPRVKNYGELAGQARQLMSGYGRLEGRLLDIQLWPDAAMYDTVIRKTISEFDAIKGSKDTSLHDMPRKPTRPHGLTVDERGVQTWPADTYLQAKMQARRSGRAKAAAGAGGKAKPVAGVEEIAL